MIYKSDTVASK